MDMYELFNNIAIGQEFMLQGAYYTKINEHQALDHMGYIEDMLYNDTCWVGE